MEGVFETKKFGKATIYRLSMFGYVKTEVKEGEVERRISICR